jgi:hypothetical protein
MCLPGASSSWRPPRACRRSRRRGPSPVGDSEQQRERWGVVVVVAEAVVDPDDPLDRLIRCTRSSLAASATVASRPMVIAGLLISSAAVPPIALARCTRRRRPSSRNRWKESAGCCCLSSRSASETIPDHMPVDVDHGQGTDPPLGEQADQLLVRSALPHVGDVGGHDILDLAPHDALLSWGPGRPEARPPGRISNVARDRPPGQGRGSRHRRALWLDRCPDLAVSAWSRWHGRR